MRSAIITIPKSCLRQESRSYYNYHFCCFYLAVIPLGSTELLGTGKHSLSCRYCQCCCFYPTLIPFGPKCSWHSCQSVVVPSWLKFPLNQQSYKVEGIAEPSTVALLLFLPGCNSFMINRAAGDRDTELGAVAFVLLLFLPGCDSLRIHRAAGDRDSKLGAAAIVVVPTWL
jgi:hypothetical protein